MFNVSWYSRETSSKTENYGLNMDNYKTKR